MPTPDRQPAIQLEHIGVVYHNRKTGNRTALNDFSLTADNEMLALLGPNGSGKSTLLNVISQSLIPAAGKVLAPTSRKSLSIVFQTPALDQLLTVQENLIVAGALHNLSKTETQSRITSIATDLEIQDRLNDQVRHLSGGLARRADLARALITHPTVLLLDEPTTGLDIDARRIFWETLDRTRKQHAMTVLLATHITEEAEHADRVIMMREGQIAHQGSPTTLKESLGNRIVRIESPSIEQTNQLSIWLTEQSIEHTTSNTLLIGAHADPSLTSSCPIQSASITIAPPTLADVYTYYAHSSVNESTTGSLT